MDRSNTHNDASTSAPGDAERWFVRVLEPDCPDEVRTAFERWYAANPANAVAYRAVEQIWKQGEDAVRDPAIVALANQALRRSTATPWFRHRWLWSAAVSAAVAVIAALVIPHWRTAPADDTDVAYSTDAGQQRSITLSDGSTIFLDTHSEVVVRYSAQTRSVTLLHGQAQFKVHGDHAWPFVVTAQHGTVTAVGTWFDVRINDDATAVTLIEGKLAIATAAPDGMPQQASLVGGEGLSFDDVGHITPAHPADIAAAQSWTHGKLVVHNWRLADLLAEMNRYNTTQLQLGDSSLQDIRISGDFRTNDLPTTLLILQRGWQIHAQRVDANRIVLQRGQ